MEFRKLISFGKSSYIVTLPKEWISRNNLKKGSALSIESDRNSVTISTNLGEKESEKKSMAINIDNKSMDEIRTEIVTAYLTNYDIIEILSKSVKDKDEKVKEIIKDLAGLLILEQTATKITAKYFFDEKEISLGNFIRRMDNITRSLVIDSIECIDGARNHTSIKQRDMDINRLNFLVIRTVRAAMGSTRVQRKIGKTISQLYKILIVAEKLEKIADRQKRISRDLQSLKLSRSFGAKLKEIYNTINQAFKDVMKSYYHDDKILALKIEISNKSRINSCDKLLSSDIRKEYRMIRENRREKLVEHLHEHMIMSNIINNLKAMTTSVKMLARAIMNSTD